MVILILIDNRYPEKAVFSFEKGSNCQNHCSSGSHLPVTHPLPFSQIYDSPVLPPPLTAIWKTLETAVQKKTWTLRKSNKSDNNIKIIEQVYMNATSDIVSLPSLHKDHRQTADQIQTALQWFSAGLENKQM